MPMIVKTEENPLPLAKRSRKPRTNKNKAGFDWIQQEPLDLPAPILIRADETTKIDHLHQSRLIPQLQPKPARVLTEVDSLIAEVNSAVLKATVDHHELETMECKLNQALIKEATSALAEIGIRKLQAYQRQKSNEVIGSKFCSQIDVYLKSQEKIVSDWRD